MSSSFHTTAPRIVAERVSFARPDGRDLFRNLSLAFGNERTGLIGPNGVGKSTLAELLVGTLTPQNGTVHRVGRVAYLAQEITPPPDATLAHVLGVQSRLDALRRAYEGHATAADVELIGDAWDLEERIVEVLARFGLSDLPLHRAASTLSGGERARLALARVEMDEPDFVILDEPSNHLDAAGRALLAQCVDERRGGLLCISHNRALLRRMDRIVALSSEGAQVFGGNYDAHQAARAAEEAAAARELQSAHAALARAERDAREHRERQARRDARGRRTRATTNMPKIFLNAQRERSQATGARVLRITEREVEERRSRLLAARSAVEARTTPRFTIESAVVHPARTVLALTDVRVCFPDAVAPALEGFTLCVTGPERVALVGPNGSGKTTALKVAAGLLAPDRGDVHRALPTATAYLDQHALTLDPSRTVLENFLHAHPRTPPSAVRHVLARFDFAADDALQRVETLSGGARLRAALACALAGTEPPALLLLDEPTNHLDVDALTALEAALRAYRGALVVASHDTEFLEAIGVQRRVLRPAVQ